MRTPTFRLLAAAALSLPGCAKGPPPEQPAATVATPAPAPVAAPAQAAGSTGLRDAIQQPIDKAKATGDATLKAAEEQRKQIDAAGG